MARVEGFLESMDFQEGKEVKKGQLLYTIEDSTYVAESLKQESALAKSNADVVKAKADLERYKPLAAKNAVSQTDLDQAVDDYKAAQASVKASEASLKAANVNLSYTKIYSPVDGVIGQTNYRVGDLVGSSSDNAILNTVSELNNMRVRFFITEQSFLKNQKN